MSRWTHGLIANVKKTLPGYNLVRSFFIFNLLHTI
nr:MAG TPA: hypothetical protein [Caudoviricetes sp.]